MRGRLGGVGLGAVLAAIASSMLTKEQRQIVRDDFDQWDPSRLKVGALTEDPEVKKTAKNFATRTPPKQQLKMQQQFRRHKSGRGR